MVMLLKYWSIDHCIEEAIIISLAVPALIWLNVSQSAACHLTSSRLETIVRLVVAFGSKSIALSLLGLRSQGWLFWFGQSVVLDAILPRILNGLLEK